MAALRFLEVRFRSIIWPFGYMAVLKIRQIWRFFFDYMAAKRPIFCRNLIRIGAFFFRFSHGRNIRGSLSKIHGWLRKNFEKIYENLQIFGCMAVSKISVNPSARYDSFRLYGLSVIWPKKADFGRLINSVRLYGRPYNRKLTVELFTTDQCRKQQKMSLGARIQRIFR